VFDALKSGDELACEIAEEFGFYLGKGLAMVGSVVNPEAFVIGGGVSKAGNILIDYVAKYYVQYVFHGSRDAKFLLATLGNDAGIYGSAKLVL
jgi:glucokinase